MYQGGPALPSYGTMLAHVRSGTYFPEVPGSFSKVQMITVNPQFNLGNDSVDFWYNDPLPVAVGMLKSGDLTESDMVRAVAHAFSRMCSNYVLRAGFRTCPECFLACTDVRCRTGVELRALPSHGVSGVRTGLV